VDELYDFLFVQPIKFTGRMLNSTSIPTSWTERWTSWQTAAAEQTVRDGYRLDNVELCALHLVGRGVDGRLFVLGGTVVVHLIGLSAATPGSLTSNSLSLPILSIILFLPLAGALLISFLNDERQIKVASVVVVALDFVLAMFVLADFKFDAHTWSSSSTISTTGYRPWHHLLARRRWHQRLSGRPHHAHCGDRSLPRTT
jgi:hypothetical protein